MVCGPRLRTESRGGWGGQSEGGGKGVSLIVLGRGIGGCPGNCPKLRQRRGGAPAKPLSGVQSDSTREQVYLITRLGTLGSSEKVWGQGGVLVKVSMDFCEASGRAGSRK